MQKFSTRRKSVVYRTDLPVFRPSILDMVRDARNRLLAAKSRLSTGWRRDRLLWTESKVRGLGKCVLLPGHDVAAALAAYGDLLARYGLHVSQEES